MATTDKTFITTQGRKMLVDLDNDRAHANGFNIYFSTGDLTGMTDDQIVNLQDIQNKDIKVKADVIKLDQGDTKIRAQATYTGPEKGIYIKTYATYAVDSNNNEMLFAIYLNSEPQYLLSSANGNETTQGYGFNIGISQTDNVDFTKLSNITATLQDVQQMVDGGDAVTLHTVQDIPGDKNFTGKLQKNSVDIATINDVSDKLSQFSGDDKDHNFTAKLQHNGIDVATIKDVADQTDIQFNNAVKTAKNYTDSHTTSEVLDMPTTAMQVGDSYNNYAGKYVHLDINGINIANDVGDSDGLPSKIIYGDFVSIPNHNFTTQIINDKSGSSWRRASGNRWGLDYELKNNFILNLIRSTVVSGNLDAFYSDITAQYYPDTKTIIIHGNLGPGNNGFSYQDTSKPIISFSVSGISFSKIVSYSFPQDGNYYAKLSNDNSEIEIYRRSPGASFSTNLSGGIIILQ